MRIIVNGRNIEVTDAIKAYVKEKIGKVASHYDQITDIEVILSVIKNPSVSESHSAVAKCILTTGKLIVEESAESMYASVDILADKLDRQVKKHKEKNLKSKNKTASIRTESSKEEIEEETVETV